MRPARTPAAASPQMQAADVTPAPTTDGRVHRSVVTRKKIVDALTALVYEGQLAPTAQQVAARADIGLRTVFRHFEDMDSLYREISMDLDALVQPVLQVRLSAPTWQERLLQSIEHRAELFDRTAAMHLAAQVHRHESAYLADNVMDTARLQRELLKRLLPQQVLDNPTLLDALDLVLSFEAWIRLRREQSLNSAQAREVMRLGVQALLAMAGQAR